MLDEFIEAVRAYLVTHETLQDLLFGTLAVTLFMAISEAYDEFIFTDEAAEQLWTEMNARGIPAASDAETRGDTVREQLRQPITYALDLYLEATDPTLVALSDRRHEMDEIMHDMGYNDQEPGPTFLRERYSPLADPPPDHAP